MGTKPEIIKVDNFTFEVNGTAVEFDSVDSIGDQIAKASAKDLDWPDGETRADGSRKMVCPKCGSENWKQKWNRKADLRVGYIECYDCNKRSSDSVWNQNPVRETKNDSVARTEDDRIAWQKLSPAVRNEMSVLNQVADALKRNSNVQFCKCGSVRAVNQNMMTTRRSTEVEIECVCGRMKLEFIIPDSLLYEKDDIGELLSVAQPAQVKVETRFEPDYENSEIERVFDLASKGIIDPTEVQRFLGVDSASPDSERTGVAVLTTSDRTTFETDGVNFKKASTEPTKTENQKGIPIHDGKRKNRHVDF